MSYELRIWDPSRHGPAPTSADGALDLVESLLDTPAEPNSALERFGQSLVDAWEATHDSSVSGDVTLAEFWGGAPRQQTRACETAARVLHKDPAAVTSDERSMAKMVNFGLAYGMSDFGL